MPNVKWTTAELAIWNIFLVAVGAAITGGAPALLEYMAGTNVDVTLTLKLALAGAIGAFVASISTYFRRNGNAVTTLLQAMIDLLGQVHDAVTTQVNAVPQPTSTPPQPIVLAPQPASTTYVPPVFAQPVQPPVYVQPSQTAQGPIFTPNLNATATAAPPAFAPSFVPDLTGAASSATGTVPWIAPSPDIRFGDTGIVPIIPKP